MSLPKSARALLVTCNAILLLACVDSRGEGNAVGEEEGAGQRGTAVAILPLLDAPDAFFSRGDVTLRYRSIGDGEPILLVHGYGDKVEMWTGTADSLARDHRVVAVDVRGFGKSSKPAGVSSYGAPMVDDLVALLDHLAIPRVHAVGYSMGAVLVANLTLRFPERVRTATLVAGAFWPDSAATHKEIAPFIAALERGERLTALVRWAVPSLSDSVAREFSDQLFAESDSAALTDALKSFPALTLDWSKVSTSSTPVLAVVGLDDPLQRYSRLLAGRWPGARLVELPNVDHVIVFNAPELLREVRALVASNPAAAVASTGG